MDEPFDAFVALLAIEDAFRDEEARRFEALMESKFANNASILYNATALAVLKSLMVSVGVLTQLKLQMMSFLNLTLLKSQAAMARKTV